MDKVAGTFDPNTGETRDLNGNVVTGTVTVNGTELNTAILADAVWQGCSHMMQEASEPGTGVERRAFLLERVKTALTYHYIILGFDEREAAEQAENYLSKMK